PSGSAGAPILAASDGAGLVDCVVVVTRYIGRTKLGVVGLIRAYGDAAALAVQDAPVRRAIPAFRAPVRYPYAHTAAVMRALERTDADDLEHGYGAGGVEGTVAFTLPRDALPLLRELLREQTAGAVEPEVLGETTRFRA